MNAGLPRPTHPPKVSGEPFINTFMCDVLTSNGNVTVTVYPSSRIDHLTPLMILHFIQSNSTACSNSMNCNYPLI